MAKDIISGIYKIVNKINNKSYIGQSNNIYRRFSEHKSPLYRSHYSDKYLYKAIDKYGIENFSFDIIEECEACDLDDREVYWINYYEGFKNGYNNTLGGQNFNGIDPVIHKQLPHIVAMTGYNANDGVEMMELICNDADIEDYKGFVSCFDETMEDLSPEEVYDYYDGIDTTVNDFCDGYDSFESWAECNL